MKYSDCNIEWHASYESINTAVESWSSFIVVEYNIFLFWCPNGALFQCWLIKIDLETGSEIKKMAYKLSGSNESV